MGGIVKAVTGAIKDTVDFIGDVADKAVDAVKKTVEVATDIIDLAITTIVAPTKIIIDTVIKGESFKGSIAKQIQEMGKDLGDVYDSLLNDVLGIDDDGFLGIKGGIFSKIGQAVKDFSHDHATQTIGIGIIVAAVVVSILFPPAYGLATAVTTAAYTAGITSTFGLMAVWYTTLAVAYLGITVLTSGLIDGSVLAMYGRSVFDNIFMYEEAKEALRLAGLASILDGTIYDRLAGGWMYDSQFAGGVYYDAGNVANLGISVGDEFKVSPHLIGLEIGFIDNTMKNLPGDTGFNVLSMTTNPK